MSQKGLAPIVIVLVIAAVAGAFYLGKTYNKPTSTPSQQATQPSPTPATNPAPNGAGETANWKTYKNKGIYFKYPSDWDISPYTSDTLITSSSPKIRLVIVPKDGTLMNECMQEISEEIKNDLTIRKFTRVTTGAMCSTSDTSPREIWVVPSKGAYSPGISYQYSATESRRAEEIFNQILSTFRFD